MLLRELGLLFNINGAGVTIQVLAGDCIEVMRRLDPDSIHACLIDPPYGLEFMGKEWDGADGFRRSLNSADAGRDSAFGRLSSHGPEYRTSGAGQKNRPGIGNRETEWVNNQGWNQYRCATCGHLFHGGSPCQCAGPQPIRADNRWNVYQAWCEAWARELYRVLKPGAHLLAFGGTRTYHRLACAIEDAGFEIRDQFAWMYGSGFPKSRNASKAIDQELGAERKVVGRRTDGPSSWMIDQKLEHRANGGTGLGYADGSGKEYDVTAPATREAAAWEGFGTAVKPAWEPLVLARKPMVGSLAQNLLKHGTGALNIDACRIGTSENLNGGAYASAGEKSDRSGSLGGGLLRSGIGEYAQPTGRWPANVAHDGSDEVEAAFAKFGERTSGKAASGGHKRNASLNADMAIYDGGLRSDENAGALYGDTGTASRFFFSAKADVADRADSKHPTVKPVDLIRNYVRLITPPGGTVLDCFAGSGTTGEAAMLEKFDCILIERDPKSVADIQHRIKRWSGQDAPLFMAAQ